MTESKSPRITTVLRGTRGRRAFHDLRRPVFAVADAQRFFCMEGSRAQVKAWTDIEPNVIALLDGFRAAGMTATVTRQVHPQGDDTGVFRRFFASVLHDSDPMSALMPTVAAHAEGLPIIDKARFSCFSSPRFVELVAGHDCLILAGVQTHLTVLATALDAIRHGVVPIVIVDAVGARREGDHAAALQVLAGGHAHLATTHEIWQTFLELDRI